MDLSLKGLAKRFPKHNLKITAGEVNLFELQPKKVGGPTVSVIWSNHHDQKTFRDAVIRAEELLCKTTS